MSKNPGTVQSLLSKRGIQARFGPLRDGFLAWTRRESVQVGLILLVTAFGLVIRLVQYIHYRMLWMDESVLAAYLLTQLNRRALPVALLALLMLAGPPIARAAGTLAHPLSRNRFDETLSFVQTHWEPGDLLYLSYPDSLAYAFGKRNFNFQETDIVAQSEPRPGVDHLKAFLDEEVPRFKTRRRVWFPLTFFNYAELEFLLTRLDQHGQPGPTANAHGAFVVAYEFGPPK